MVAFDYNDRVFVGIENYEDGDLTPDTRFHYRQVGETVWGTLEGGRARFGTLVAKVLPDGRLDMVWQYLNVDGEFRSGKCISVPEVLADGRYRLHETWQFDDGVSGTSMIEEIRQ